VAVSGRLRDLQKRLDREPENLGLRVMVAGALREVGHDDEAVELYRSVARVYREQGRTQQALAVCRSLLEIAPGDGPCKLMIAELTEGPTPVPEAPSRPSADASAELMRPSDLTPLPAPLAYHEAYPTASVQRLTVRPEELRVSEGGITHRDLPIQPALIAASDVIGLSTRDDDLAAELDTRQRVKLETGELDKLEVTEGGLLPEERVSDDEITRSHATSPGAIGTDVGGAAAPHGDADDDWPDEQTQPRDVIEPGSELLAGAFFSPLPADRRADMLAKFTPRTVRAGTAVIEQGKPATALYVIVRGRVELRLARAIGSALSLGSLGPGEFVGEGALLARKPAASSAIASEDCELLALAPRDFYDAAAAFPSLWAALKAVAEHRQRQLDGRIKR
jgi:hypothetical protein